MTSCLGLLSLQRQKIEIAFGLLVARWGIFWRALRFSPEEIEFIMNTYCKFHNIYVDAFGSSINSVDVSTFNRDWVRAPNITPASKVHDTDGTTARQGAWSDLVTKRARITQELFDMGLQWPSHSKSRALLNCIKDIEPCK